MASHCFLTMARVNSEREREKKEKKRTVTTNDNLQRYGIVLFFDLSKREFRKEKK